MSNNETELQQGPYKDTHTKVIKIAPVEITITESRDSTHVPKKNCGCSGGGMSLSDLMAAAQAVGSQVAQQAAGGPGPTVSPFPPGFPDDHGHDH